MTATASTDATDARYSLRRWKPTPVRDLVRVGRDNDGGYVVSQRSIAATRVVIGMGIFDDWSFEADFIARKPGIGVIGIDGSVSEQVFRSRSDDSFARALMAGVRLRPRLALMHLRETRRFRRTSREFARFFGAPGRAFHQRFITDEADAWSMTWREVLRSDEHVIGPDRPDLGIFVKMDIETAEYRVLADLVADEARINGMVVEFHACDLFWERFEDTMNALTGPFAVIHVHGNNFEPLIRGSSTPRVLEISFLNRRLLSPSDADHRLEDAGAHLDRPCNPGKPDHVIRF